MVWIAFAGAAQLRGQTPGGAQAPSQVPVIKVHTGLVLIPTIVTDRDGKHVADLSKEDFTVLENGKPQAIGYFRHVQTKAELMKPSSVPGDEVTNEVEGHEKRLTIFVLDFLNSNIAERKTGLDDLRKFLLNSLDLKEPLCLLALNQSGISVVHDFTTDPAVLAQALQNIHEGRSPTDVPKGNPIENTFRLVQGWHSTSDTRNEAAEQGRLDALAATTIMAYADDAQRVRLTLEALQSLGEAFAGIHGRKSLIWATAGFPFEIDDAATLGWRSADLLPAYERAWHALDVANIAVYPLDVGGLVNPAAVSPAVGRPLPQHFRAQTNMNNLEVIAEATGGKFCDRRNDAQSCFREAAKDSSDYYEIGIYQPPGKITPGWRKLNVKLVNAGDRQVRARSGYYVRRPKETARDRKREVEIALVSPLEYTAIPLVVKWEARKEVAPDGKRVIDFRFALRPGTATIDEANDNHMSLVFAALARNASGTAVQTFSKTIEGNLPQNTADEMKLKGVTFDGQMNLVSGEYTLTFAVRDDLSGEIGTVSSLVAVP